MRGQQRSSTQKQWKLLATLNWSTTASGTRVGQTASADGSTSTKRCNETDDCARDQTERYRRIVGPDGVKRAVVLWLLGSPLGQRFRDEVEGSYDGLCCVCLPRPLRQHRSR